MTDFLTRLAERALGVAPVAAPDLPPMFAPTAQPLEQSTEVVAPRPTAARISADESRFSKARVENSTSQRPIHLAREYVRGSDELRSPLVNVGLVPSVAEDAAFSMHRPEQVAQAVAQAAGDSSSSAAVSMVPGAVAVKARNETAPINTKPTLLSEALVSSPIRGEAVAPAIHVTIGRVEVRAVTAPAEPARPRERKAPPLLSLDQYLRQRNEGRQ